MHVLPQLSYEYSDLEPHIDARTMEIHHTKHHQGYVDKLNAALEAHPELADKDIEVVLRDMSAVPADIQGAVQNNGGGHANHSLFWSIIAPSKDSEIGAELGQAISDAFGSVEEFKEEFSAAAAARFGSGWAWLVVQADGNLAVYSTPNQDSPLMQGDTPILGLDVWEHAYYLNYQNKRPDYIQAFWNIVNWSAVAKNYQAAQ